MVNSQDNDLEAKSQDKYQVVNSQDNNLEANGQDIYRVVNSQDSNRVVNSLDCNRVVNSQDNNLEANNPNLPANPQGSFLGNDLLQNFLDNGHLERGLARRRRILDLNQR